MKFKQENLFCILTILIVFLFFSHTVNYPWKYFDEQIIYDETILPIAKSFGEIFEYLSSFGLVNYFEASNPFYSSISNLRCDPVNNLITLFVYYFFQKNVFAYHALSLFFHLLNTFILFQLLNKISMNSRTFLVTILTLLWALHPVNVEPILFTTNWSAILTYSLCLILVFYFINTPEEKVTATSSLITFFLFLIPLFTCEYSVTVPLILFFYTFAKHRYSNANTTFSNTFFYTLKKTLPLFLALMVFIIYFISSPIKENIQSRGVLQYAPTLSITLERIFWLSPQIFFHFIKLVLFPLHLSIDQTAMVKISKSFFDPYSLFCTLFMYLTLVLLFISFLQVKKKGYYLFFISLMPFIIALLPFLHIFSPAYCLASERYLYFPLLILIFGISHVLFSCRRDMPWHVSTLVILSILVCTMGTRTYIRTLDWKDSLSLFTSALKEAPNDLFKGLRFEMLGTIKKSKEYLSEGISILENSLLKLEKEKKNEQNIPQVLKIYGLDAKTIQAKTAYLLAFTKLGLGGNFKDTLELLRPYVKNLTVLDTQILDLYIGLLFQSGELDEAKKVLKNQAKYRLSPLTLIAFSELYKLKKDPVLSEKYLKQAFKYFPYDIQVLSSLKRFYFEANNANKFAYFSYLYGIRTHTKQSLEDAYNIFKNLNDSKMAEKAFSAMKEVI